MVDVGDLAPSLDTDRYLINGELTQVVLGTRELNLADLSWEREHVRLTHGYGLALAGANATTPEGSPSFLAGGLPVETDPTLALQLDQPQIYHGEVAGTPSLAPRSTKSTMWTVRPTRTCRFATTATRALIWGRSFGGCARCGSVRSTP